MLPTLLAVSICWILPTLLAYVIVGKRRSAVRIRPDVIVRVADLSTNLDAKCVTTLLNEYAMDPFGDGSPLSSAVLSKLAKALAQVPGAFSVLAFDAKSGRPIGLANCFAGFSTFKCKPLVNIHDCYVHRDYRGMGVVDKIVTEVERIALERGCCKITLEVLSANHRAQNAYRKAGFGAYELDPAAGQALFWQKVLTGNAVGQARRQSSPARRR